MIKRSLKKNPIRVREITPYCDIVIDGVAWKAVEHLPGDGWELRTKDRPTRTRMLTREEYERLKDAKRVVLIDEVQSFASLASLTEKQRDTTVKRHTWMSVIDEYVDENLGGSTEALTRAQVTAIIEDNKNEVYEAVQKYHDDFDRDQNKPRKKLKFGSSIDQKNVGRDTNPDRVFACAKTLHDTYRRWVAADRDFWKLVPNTGAHHGGGAEIDDRTWNMITANVKEYACEKNATLVRVRDLINAKIARFNASVGEDYVIPPATVYGVVKAIAELPAAIELGGRLNKKNMAKVLKHVGQGPQYKRIGEVTLHDCWTTQLMNLIDPKAWHLFTDDQLETRVALAAVVDAATGCIVGLRAGHTENARLAASAFRMAVSDKRAVAEAAGCHAPWDMRIGIEGVRSDSGGAYRSSLFMSAAYALVDRLAFTSAGRANLRGQIERKFRTMDVDFIRSFLGRTGSNVVDRPKDEQDPQERASLYIHEFMRLAIRYVVDKLHYSRPSKVGPSPARKFEEIRGRIQCKAPPSREEIRVAFGITVVRKLNRAGIRFMNILYWNSWLDIVLQHAGPTDVYVKVDEEDLGCISVLIGEDWTTIPGPRQFDGLRLSDWLEQNAELARKYGEQAALDFKEFVAPAILDIDKAAKDAEKHFHMLDVYWTPEMMDQIEKDLRVLVVYDRDPLDREEALTEDSTALGSVYTRDDVPAAVARHDERQALGPLGPDDEQSTKPHAAPPNSPSHQKKSGAPSVARTNGDNTPIKAIQPIRRRKGRNSNE